MIGCAVGERDIRMLQLRTTRDGRTTLHKAAAPLPAGLGREPWTSRGEMARLFRRTWAKGDFVGSNAVVTLPDACVQYRRIKLATMPDGEMAEAVRWQLARELDRPVDSICTAHYPPRHPGDGSAPRAVLACALARQDSEAIATALLDANLTPCAIDAAAGAYTRGFDHAADGMAGGRTLFLFVVHADSAMLLVYEGNRPSLIRVIPGGRARLAQRVTAAVGDSGPDVDAVDALFTSDEAPRPMSPAMKALCDAMPEACRLLAKELAQELRLCFQHLRREGAAPTAPCGCLLGAGPWHQALADMLAEASDVAFAPPAAWLHPAYKNLLTDHELSNGWLLPLGLACETPVRLNTREAA